MVRLAELEKSSRLQRLLWTEEYACLKTENVVIESSFVLEDSQGGPLKMVRGGLTPQVLVLAEYIGRCKTEREEINMSGDTSTGFDFLNIENEGLDDMELLWLLPLENVHLTVSKRATRHDLRVLRLRFCSGKLYHLELSEASDSDKMWDAWINSLVELNRHRHKVLRGLVVADSHHSTFTENQSNNKSNIPDWRDIDSHRSDHIVGGSEQTLNGRVPVETTGKDSLAVHLVSHFKDHLKHSPAVEVSHHHNIAMQQDHSSNQLHTSQHHHLGSTTSLREATDVSTSSSVTTTTESDGSAFSASSVSRLLRHLDLEAAFKMCLFIGDYFGQFLFEAGTSGLPQRMASMSAMRHFIEADDCNMDSDDAHFGFGIEKDALRQSASLPSHLDGEASFVEDLKQVDDVTHRTSLVYLDLANEDGEKQAHVINGHVMLITPEEFRLFREVKKHREQPMDLRFATARHPDVVRKRTKAAEELHTRRGAIVEMSDKIRTRLHRITHKFEHSRTTEKDTPKHDHKAKPKQKRSHRLKTYMKKVKKSEKAKSNISLNSAVPSSVCHHFEYIYEIEIDDVARELTAIDGELFLRVHEAELISCMWLRDEKHHRSPNMLACIEFFHRVFGIVVTEILLPIEPNERAELMARFTRIANQCFAMKNFHSTKAIMSAFQTPAIQRLKDTWGCFERAYPESYRIWQDIYKVMSDEGCYQTYVNHLKEAMSTPPCIPFLGPFLKQITEYYMNQLIPQRVHCPTNDQRFEADDSPTTTTQDSNAPSINSELPTHPDDQGMSMSSIFKAGKSSTVAMLSRIGLSIGKEQSHVSHLSSKDNFVDARSNFSSYNDGLSNMSDPCQTTINHSPYDVSSSSSEIYLQTTKRSMSTDRKRQIQSLIIDYAKQLAQKRGIEWDPKRSSTAPNTWDFVLEEAFDWSSLFKRVTEAKDVDRDVSHKFSELALLVKEEKTHGYCLDGISSELDITSTLFHFQLAVVRYRIQSKENVRDFLMKAHYNSDVENFTLSLRREPPTGHQQHEHW